MMVESSGATCRKNEQDNILIGSIYFASGLTKQYRDLALTGPKDILKTVTGLLLSITEEVKERAEVKKMCNIRCIIVIITADCYLHH